MKRILKIIILIFLFSGCAKQISKNESSFTFLSNEKIIALISENDVDHLTKDTQYTIKNRLKKSIGSVVFKSFVPNEDTTKKGQMYIIMRYLKLL
ncbi:MAG: hypothetical protein ACK5KR_01195 [Breznakia sp.]